MFAPLRFAPWKFAQDKIASSRLAFVRFLFFRLIWWRVIFLLTASSRHDLKFLKKPANRVSPVFIDVSL